MLKRIRTIFLPALLLATLSAAAESDVPPTNDAGLATARYATEHYIRFFDTLRDGMQKGGSQKGRNCGLGVVEFDPVVLTNVVRMHLVRTMAPEVLRGHDAFVVRPEFIEFGAALDTPEKKRMYAVHGVDALIHDATEGPSEAALKVPQTEEFQALQNLVFGLLQSEQVMHAFLEPLDKATPEGCEKPSAALRASPRGD